MQSSMRTFGGIWAAWLFKARFYAIIPTIEIKKERYTCCFNRIQVRRQEGEFPIGCKDIKHIYIVVEKKETKI